MEPESASPPVTIAHDPQLMRATLQRYLQGSEETSYQVQECRIANTRRRDGSRGTTQYDLRMEDPATGHVWDQIVTGVSFEGDRTRRVWESIRQSSGPSATTTARPALPPFAYVPELDLLLQVFPHDHRLPGLARLIAGPPPELLPALMEEFGPGDWVLRSWDAATVQYRADMRAILLLTLEAANTIDGQTSTRQSYAKIYRDAEHGRRAHDAQSSLYENATAVRTHLVVAKPIVYADDLRTLVTEAVPGTSLSKIVRRGKDSGKSVRLAARAVAEFHQLDAIAPRRSLANEMARLQEAQVFLATARPDLASEVSSMVEVIAAGLAGAPATLIHGDLKPDHILIDGDRVALIDFDLLGIADPVGDVAHLLAFLGKPQERSRSRRDDSEDVAQVFVDEYFTHAPDSWRARLPLHHAMTSIHKAVGLCRRRGDERQGVVEDILREGQRFLENGADGSVPSYKRRLTRSTVR